jgi:ABC-type Fe3+/spermidine/putrescine transport system ATPase subunit
VAVRVEGIAKAFPAGAALEDVSLDFAPGALTTLLGPSGCGKTTLLRIIAGFVAPDRGRVLLAGIDRTAEPAWRRNVGLVFQSYALWPHMTVFDNIAYGLRLRRRPRGEITAVVERALQTIGLAGMGGRHPGLLSGGQQQRVALARALVLEPDVLLLDEPLSSLDARMRVEMRREIRRLQREVGITTIYVTHDQEEALELSDVVAVMSGGRVEQVGPPEEVYRRPRSTAVAAFVGTVTVLEGEAQADGRLVVDGRGLPLALPPELAGRRVRVGLRPEDVELHPDPARGPLPGRVVECAYRGHVFRVVVRVGEGLDVVADSRQGLEVGRAVSLTPRGATLFHDD